MLEKTLSLRFFVLVTSSRWGNYVFGNVWFIWVSLVSYSICSTYSGSWDSLSFHRIGSLWRLMRYVKSTKDFWRHPTLQPFRRRFFSKNILASYKYMLFLATCISDDFKYRKYSDILIFSLFWKITFISLWNESIFLEKSRCDKKYKSVIIFLTKNRNLIFGSFVSII